MVATQTASACATTSELAQSSLLYRLVSSPTVLKFGTPTGDHPFFHHLLARKYQPWLTLLCGFVFSVFGVWMLYL